MDPDRKRQILNAEARFTLRERLSRALAEKGVYVLGRLTHEPRTVPDPEEAPPAPGDGPEISTGTVHVVEGPADGPKP